MLTSPMIFSAAALLWSAAPQAGIAPFASFELNVPAEQEESFIAAVQLFALEHRLDLLSRSYEETPLGMRSINLRSGDILISIRNPSRRAEYRVDFYDLSGAAAPPPTALATDFRARFSQLID